MAIVNGKLYSGYGIGSSNIGVTGANTLIANTWTHVAVSRSGTTLRLFVNGVVDATATVSGAYNNSNAVLSIGRINANDAGYLKGHISNLRIINGTALYTGNFSIPTSPTTAVANTKLLANFANAGAVDSAKNLILTTVGNAKISTEQSKFGGSSVYFDGNGDYLRIADNAAFNFGSGDFTIEMWLNPTAPTNWNQKHLFAKRATNNNWGLLCYINRNSTTGRYSVTMFIPNAAGTGWAINKTVPISFTGWSHFALVRSGNEWSIYIDGVKDVLNANLSLTIPSNTAAFTLGADAATPSTTSSNYVGYMDDIRITKGVARYTEAFTPPDALSAP